MVITTTVPLDYYSITNSFADKIVEKINKKPSRVLVTSRPQNGNKVDIHDVVAFAENVVYLASNTLKLQIRSTNRILPLLLDDDSCLFDSLFSVEPQIAYSTGDLYGFTISRKINYVRTA